MQLRSAYMDRMDEADALRSILRAAFERVDPKNAVIDAVNSNNALTKLTHSLKDGSYQSRIFVWAMGKAAQSMALGLKSVFPGELAKGVAITKHNEPALEKLLLPEIISFEGDHPVPGERSARATRAALTSLGYLNPQDVVFCLISGGGSALTILPEEGITIRDYQQMTRLLLECGATIQEINTVRQQVDRIKGGGLARLLQPARVVSLILSDVVGDPLDVIASGPTIPSPHNIGDAVNILDKYDLNDKMPVRIQQLFQKKGERCGQDNFSGNSDCEGSSTNILIGNNALAAQAAKECARNLGFDAEIMTSTLQGEAREIGKKLAGELKNAYAALRGKRHCWIYGGETTVTIRGSGKGGRNQELALAAALELQGIPQLCLISIATDGEDGPTDAAGAIVDGNTIDQGSKIGLDAQQFLANNDAYSYFEKVGGLIKTGPSGTNVNDLVFLFLF